MASRYNRQELIHKIGKEGQQKISLGKVVIIGCGALGTHIANNLVRAGVGKIKIIDRDFIEMHNLQRQILFNEEDIKKDLPKAIAAKEHLTKINSEIEIISEVADVNFTNIEGFIKGFDAVVDGTDNFLIRYLLNEACDKLSIPWVYGGGISTSGMTRTIIPGKTPCFLCQFPKQPPSELILTCDTSGVLSSSIAVSAAIQSLEILKILIGKFDELNTDLLSFDIWDLNFKKLEVRKNSECDVCVRKKYDLLSGIKGITVSNLCGQNSIQIIDLSAQAPDFSVLSEKIKNLTDVKANKFLLKFSISGKDVTIFKDGRTIIKGITNEKEAKTFYDKYIGG